MAGGGGGTHSRSRWLVALGLLAAAAALVWLVRPPARTVDVFFVRVDRTGHLGTLVPVHRSPPARRAAERLRAALVALLAGPSPEEKRRGVVSEIPSGTALRGARIEDGVVIVDLTAEFGQGGGSASMRARLWQVIYTATQFREWSAAQILLDGQRVDALGGEGIVIDHPLERPETPPTF